MNVGFIVGFLFIAVGYFCYAYAQLLSDRLRQANLNKGELANASSALFDTNSYFGRLFSPFLSPIFVKLKQGDFYPLVRGVGFLFMFIGGLILVTSI